ncbi:hypothetical protein OG830_40400 [Streptomyces sp. NBC_00121]|nr:hypothetical protein [Streptomyces sp. NBC_01760]WSC66997.1 hypothetical protein OG807_00135 [Streptomyces sp. NBC_01760]WSC74295.1 hypothetical protein OG807_41075 [Streptomyces sp. NBC_01760]WTI84898.1 hypothetical protein OHB17_00840 [Streptomyces sp. NBC_00724]WTI92028.1 hypothetical protein OHB17_41165 [Streptomyces sp. NBC_00724]
MQERLAAEPVGPDLHVAVPAEGPGPCGEKAAREDPRDQALEAVLEEELNGERVL